MRVCGEACRGGEFSVNRDDGTPLRESCSGDVVWALIDPGMYQLLVNEMAWTPTQLRTWLADTLADQLLQR